MLLGRALVAPAGCGYRVEVEVEVGGAEPTATAAPFARVDGPRAEHAGAGAAAAAPAPVDAPWLPGDLQSHTHHSDARGSVAELLAAAAARGLRFLAVTDHNTISHYADLARHADGPVLPVPGMEVTTYRGHANVWGAAGWVDFRIVDEADVAAMVDRAHALGGLVSVNHPKPQPGCIGCDWTYAIPAHVDALEAWQGPWWLRNWASLARYDRLLAAGRRLTLVGGSDRHQPAGPETDPDELRVGSPTTWLQLARVSVPHVLAALKAGRASVSEGPTGPRLEAYAGTTAGDAIPTGARLAAADGHPVRARALGAVGERLRWVGAHGVVRGGRHHRRSLRRRLDLDARRPLPARRDRRGRQPHGAAGPPGPVGGGPTAAVRHHARRGRRAAMGARAREPLVRLRARRARHGRKRWRTCGSR